MPKLMYGGYEIGGVGSGSALPVGSIIPFGSDTNIPDGYLKCSGNAISRTKYDELFSVFGTTYGEGDGSTTFNLPDLTDAAILNGDYDKTEYTTAGTDTFTATRTGYYKITCIGGGGAGGNGGNNTYGGLSGTQGGTSSFGSVCSANGGHSGAGSMSRGEGGGGAAGDVSYIYTNLSAGDIVTVTVGAGGVAPSSGFSSSATGEDGSGGAGHVGYRAEGAISSFGSGGIGSITFVTYNQSDYGVLVPTAAGGSNGTQYGGGGSGSLSANYGVTWPRKSATAGSNGESPVMNSISDYPKGGDGGAGAVIVEYIGTSQNYLVKAYKTVAAEGTGGTFIEITQQEYDALPAEEKANTKKLYVITDGDAVVNTADSMPIGTITAFSANGDLPMGYLECNGAPVSRTMYPDLFSLIGTTYGEGDGSTTFNLPNLSGGEFLEGSDTAGTSHEAGLPNIEGEAWPYNNTGFISTDATYYGGATGAFTKGEDTIRSTVNNTQSYQSKTLRFDASESNPIYGASDTVQPKSITVRYIIKAFNAATPNSALVDMTQVANDLASKADRSLSNLNAIGEARLAHVVIDSYYDSTTGDWWRKYADGWIEQGGLIAGTFANPKAITFNKPMADTNFACILSTSTTETSGRTWATETSGSRTTTGINIRRYEFSGGASNTDILTWVVIGQGASA